MALWPARARQQVDAVAAMPTTRLEAREIIPGVSVQIPTYAEFVAYSELYAAQVPALTRGVRLISGTVAQLPLIDYDGRSNLNLVTPQAGVPRWVTIQRTVKDLILHGVAYWQHNATDVKYLPAADMTLQATGKLSDGRGREYTVADPSRPHTAGQVMVFTGFDTGVLTIGVDVIRTAIAQETAALNYAESPQPQGVLKNVSNYELDNTEAAALLDGWTTARQTGSTAYLNGGVEYQVTQFDATQTALVDMKNQSALAVARLLSLDPMWVGASVQGSSLTYQNRVDARTDLYGLTLSDYIVTIEQRLSMTDCGGSTTQFSTAEFLRANLDQRATMAIGLVAAGIISVDEARAYISDAPTGAPA
jgi:phage portal protein BeeE